jgi:hypothetical protein
LFENLAGIAAHKMTCLTAVLVMAVVVVAAAELAVAAPPQQPPPPTLAAARASWARKAPPPPPTSSSAALLHQVLEREKELRNELDDAKVCIACGVRCFRSACNTLLVGPKIETVFTKSLLRASYEKLVPRH